MKKVISVVILVLAFFNVTHAQGVLYTLDQCLQMAREHNRTLQNAALDIQAATEQEKEAYTKYFPQISANVMAFRLFDKMIRKDGTIPEEILILGQQFQPYVGQPYSIREFNSAYSIAATAIEPIYVGGQIHTANKLAALQKDVKTLQHDLQEKDVLQKVTEHFWQIAKLKYNLTTLDATDKYLTQIMETTQKYIQAGIKTHNDELNVRLRQQELASNRLKVSNAQHVLLLLLAQEIGATGNFDINANTPVDSELTSTDAQTAVSNRIEYQLALKNVEAQQLQVKMERGKFLPSVALGVMGFHTGFGGLSDNIKTYLPKQTINGLVFGTVSIPISDWWGGSHAIKRQKIKVQQAKNDADDAREKLIVDIESAWSNLQEAYEQIKVKQASVNQSEENLRLSTNRYKAGTEPITDLLDAERLHRQTQDHLSSALAEYQILYADYQRKIK